MNETASTPNQPQPPQEPFNPRQNLHPKIWVTVLIAIAAAAGYLAIANAKDLWPFQESDERLANGDLIDKTADWKIYKQETGLYELKMPNGWKVLSIAGDSVSSDNFGSETINGGIDTIVKVLYFTDNFGEEKPQKIESTESALLGNESAVREMIVDSQGNKILRVRTSQEYRNLTFSVELKKLEYLEIYDQILSTFKFINKADEIANWKTDAENTVSLFMKNVNTPGYGNNINIAFAELTSNAQAVVKAHSPNSAPDGLAYGLAYFIGVQEGPDQGTSIISSQKLSDGAVYVSTKWNYSGNSVTKTFIVILERSQWKIDKVQ